MRAFVATGLLDTVLPDLVVPDPAAEWAPTLAIAVARAINAALDAVDDADRPWELVQQWVSTEHKLLTDALAWHGHSVGMTVRDGVIVVGRAVPGTPAGHPTVVRLLDLLVVDGARLAYHGDFDWGGIRIANALRERFGWWPWRFDASAYRAAHASVTGGELTGRPVDAAWDPDLRPALEQHGVHVQEELVLSELIDDLAARPTVPAIG